MRWMEDLKKKGKMDGGKTSKHHLICKTFIPQKMTQTVKKHHKICHNLNLRLIAPVSTDHVDIRERFKKKIEKKN